MVLEKQTHSCSIHTTVHTLKSSMSNINIILFKDALLRLYYIHYYVQYGLLSLFSPLI